jgi:hypothetical protein
MTLTQLKQSPEWDNKMSLEKVFAQAKFLVLLKQQTLVYVITGSHVHGDSTYYTFTGLSHDRYGVTYESDGVCWGPSIASQIEAGMAEITMDKESAMRHIWECMECLPSSAFSLNENKHDSIRTLR